MSCMEEEQVVFEQLTLRDFELLHSTALNTSKNYSIIMANNRDNIRI